MGQFTDLIAQNAHYSLANALDDAESDFGQDFVAYWGLDAAEAPDGIELDDWRELRRLYGQAGKLAAVAAALLRRKGLGPSQLAEAARLSAEARDFQQRVDELLEAIRAKLGNETAASVYWRLLPQAPADPRTKQGVFQTSLELATSRLFLPSLSSVVGRVLSLLGYLVQDRGERTNAFLSLVARCYCLDHRTELAVMCRAVLDTALQEVAPDESVRATLGGQPADRIGLARRIDYFAAVAQIEGGARTAMDRVKRAGDDAIHTSPGLEPDPNALMGDLVTALGAIERYRGDPRSPTA